MTTVLGSAFLADVERALPAAGEPPLQLAEIHDRVGYNATASVAFALRTLIAAGRAAFHEGPAQRSRAIVRLYRRVAA
jgi:hypothetical protein